MESLSQGEGTSGKRGSSIQGIEKPMRDGAAAVTKLSAEGLRPQWRRQEFLVPKNEPQPWPKWKKTESGKRRAGLDSDVGSGLKRFATENGVSTQKYFPGRGGKELEVTG